MYTVHSKKIRATKITVALITSLFIGGQLVAPNLVTRLLESAFFIATAFLGMLYMRSMRAAERAEERIEGLEHRIRKAEWKLAIAKEQVEVLDQRKSEFVSVVSHQLRTPITAAKGYSSMLLEESYGKLPDRLKEPIHKIFLSSKRAAEMVADFLDLAKIEQGTIMYNFTSVDITAILVDLLSEYSHIAKKRGLTLKVNLPQKEECIATADASKVRQILSNLIDNALKYTTKGGVTVTLKKDREKGLIRITIRDTGMGLSQEDVQNLFHKFIRGARSQKQWSEGSGLGLYVAKKMLESHKGGKLWVDSEGVGKGSTFVLELLAEEKTL